jgi:hypothetical protein
MARGTHTLGWKLIKSLIKIIPKKYKFIRIKFLFTKAKKFRKKQKPLDEVLDGGEGKALLFEVIDAVVALNC